MSGDVLDGSKDLWSKDIDTTIYQITHLHFLRIINPHNI